MRNLKLATPRMTGTDVIDWQTFLTGRTLFTDAIDGQFGPLTAQATKNYQTSAGLTADGEVGPRTFASAIADGFESSTRTLELGMDASVSCLKFAAGIAGLQMKFAVRYYAQDTGKCITAAEARALSSAGLKLVMVYQDSQDKIQFFDKTQGTDNAQRALKLAAKIGQPAGSAIYFAADFDPTADEVRGPISDYFMAVNQVFNASAVKYRIGVYSSGLTCRLLRDASLVQFAWLSQSVRFAEYNAFRPRAHMIQVFPNRDILGGKLNIDDDIAQVADYGAFQLAGTVRAAAAGRKA